MPCNMEFDMRDFEALQQTVVMVAIASRFGGPVCACKKIMITRCRYHADSDNCSNTGESSCNPYDSVQQCCSCQSWPGILCSILLNSSHHSYNICRQHCISDIVFCGIFKEQYRNDGVIPGKRKHIGFAEEFCCQPPAILLRGPFAFADHQMFFVKRLCHHFEFDLFRLLVLIEDRVLYRLFFAFFSSMPNGTSFSRNPRSTSFFDGRDKLVAGSLHRAAISESQFAPVPIRHYR